MSAAETQLLERPQIGDGLPSVLLGTVGSTPVYHHTDTARLPWILKDNFLRPGANRIGGYPDPDFLWATTDPLGDMTASADRGNHYRTGRTRHVRFTLDSAAFFPWSEAPARHPQWTPDHIARLHAAAKGKSDPKTWWCRVEPLWLVRFGLIETRSYLNKQWLPLNPNSLVFHAQDEMRNDWLSVEVAGTIFASRKHKSLIGADGYEVRSFAAPPLSVQGRANLARHPMQVRTQLG